MMRFPLLVLVMLFTLMGCGRKTQEEEEMERYMREVKGGEERDRQAVRKAFQQIGGRKNVEGLIELLKHENPIVRMEATKALGELGDERVIEPLIQSWGDTSVVYRRAEKALKAIGEPAVQPIIEALKDENKDVRSGAAIMLADMCEKRAVEPLIEALKDEVEDVRGHAAYALSRIGDKKAFKPVVDALNSTKDSVVRSYIIQSLGRLGNKGTIDLLRKLFKESKDDSLRLSAASALIKLCGDNDAFNFLMDTLKNSEGIDSLIVIEKLWQAGDKRAVEPLIEILKKDNDWQMRSDVATALGILGDKRAIEPLIEALKDNDMNVRLSSIVALKSITKQDFGQDYGKWKQWYEKNKDK